MYKYDYDKGVLLFESNRTTYSLQLRPRITVITGDTSTGKTFLVNSIIAEKKIATQLDANVLKNVFIFNGALPDDIEGLVIIDKGDLVCSSKICEQILNTRKLHFLIFARGITGLSLSPNYFGEFKTENNVVTIKYEFSERLWFSDLCNK